MTTPTFRAISTQTTAFASAVKVAAPASTQAGDRLLFIIASTGGSAITPAGFTPLGSVTPYNGSEYNALYGYERTAQPGDAGAEFTFSISGGLQSSFAATISAWADVKSIGGFSTFDSAANANTIPAAPVAIGAAQVRTVTAYSTTGSTITPPNTARASFFSSGSWSPQLHFVVSDDAGDPNTTRTATMSGSDGPRSAFTIALRGGSTVKVWNGSTWVVKPLMRWDGSAWVATQLKRWNGTTWETE